MDHEKSIKGPHTAQFKLNLPNELHREIKVRAAKNVRTINSEVIYLMQKGISADSVQQSDAQ